MFRPDPVRPKVGTVMRSACPGNVQQVDLQDGGVIHRMQVGDMFIYLGPAAGLSGWSNILTSTGLLGCIPVTKFNDFVIVT